MSYLLLIVFGALNSVCLSLADLSPEESSKFVEAFKSEKKPRHIDLPASRYAIKEQNFMDKDNILRFPEQMYIEEQKKPFRKSPKRTIQKIIKRNRSKMKKYTYRKATTTKPIASDDEDGFYTDSTKGHTTEKQMGKKSYRRKQTNFVRNPLRLKKLTPKRSKRSLEKDNVYILNDFDEIKFLSKENGVDTVNVNVKRYW